jgi:hypothetical protein
MYQGKYSIISYQKGKKEGNAIPVTGREGP